MLFDIIFPGKTKEAYLQAGIEDFSNRLKRYVKLGFKVTKEESVRNNDALAREKEGKLLLKKRTSSSYLVVLDPDGEQVSSEELAELIVKWENQGRQHVSFMIGGYLGLSREIIEAADKVLSLSKMTFTHEMARMILLEQLYRAYSIKAGSKYHK